MEMKHFIFLLPLWVGFVFAKDCSELEFQELHHSYTECTNNAYSNFQDNVNKFAPENLSERQRVTCQYFVEAADHCGRLLESCYDHDAIIVMKDNIISRRLIEDGGEFSASCPVVTRYNQRQSRRQPTGNNIVTRQEECTKEESELVQTQMGECSKSAASNVHFAIGKVTDPITVSDIVCRALTDIGIDCFKNLSRCFSPGDMKALRSGMLKQYQTFFLRISEGKMDVESLQYCDVMNVEFAAKGIDVPEDNTHQHSNIPVDYVYNINVPDLNVIEDTTTPVTFPQERHIPEEETYIPHENVNTDIRQEECTEEETELAQKLMDKCIKSAAENAHLAIVHITDPISVSDVVCNTLTIIDSDCASSLDRCYSSQDMNAMRSATLKQYHTFFLRITEGKLDMQSLENCDVMNVDFAAQGIISDREDNTDRHSNIPVDTPVQHSNVPVDTATTHDFLEYAYNVHDNAYEIIEDTTFQDRNVPEYTIFQETKCTKEKIESAEIQMSKCIKSTASSVQLTIENITDPNSISDYVCHALTIIGTDCFKDLSRCYSSHDMNTLRSGVLGQYYGFFLQITEGKMDEESLQNCNIVYVEFAAQVTDAPDQHSSIPVDTAGYWNVPETATAYDLNVLETTTTPVAEVQEDTFIQVADIPKFAIVQETKIPEDIITQELTIPHETTTQDSNFANDTILPDLDKVPIISFKAPCWWPNVTCDSDKNDTQHTPETVQPTDNLVDASAPEANNNRETAVSASTESSDATSVETSNNQVDTDSETANKSNTSAPDPSAKNEKLTLFNNGNLPNLSAVTMTFSLVILVTFCHYN